MIRQEQDGLRAIVVGASSDIATELCIIWRSRNWHITGTFRNASRATDNLVSKGIDLIECDFIDLKSIDLASLWLMKHTGRWDILVLATGTMNPIGKFGEVNPDNWSASITANVLGPLRMLHDLLPFRLNTQNFVPTVVLFAGAGTNNAPTNYSAYVISKIAVMKMTELLAAEYPDTKFVIVGPGWVKTKIHNETLTQRDHAGENFHRTCDKIESEDWTPVSDVVECLDWLFAADHAVVSGRNFSVASGEWRRPELPTLLMQDPNTYKLRRHGNSIVEQV